MAFLFHLTSLDINESLHISWLMNTMQFNLHRLRAFSLVGSKVNITSKLYAD